MRSSKAPANEPLGKKVCHCHHAMKFLYIIISLQGVGGGMSKLMSVLHQNAATLVNSKSELNGPDQVCNIEFSHHAG